MKNLPIFLFFLFTISVQAQTKISVEVSGDSSFTLKQCIDYALKNHASMKNAQLDQTIAQAKIGEVRSIGLPQINGSVGIIENTKLRRMFMQKNNQNPFFASDTNMAKIPDGTVLDFPNFFQLRSGGDAGATLSQLIFSGSYFVGLQAAKAYGELSQKGLQQTKIQVIENVTKAYYLVLINQERVNLFNTNIARLDTLLRHTRALQQNGFAEKIDVSRIEVTYNNLLTEKIKFDNLFTLSEVLLKFQMGKPIEENISLSEKFSNIELNSSIVNEKVDYSKRVEYSLLQSQKSLQLLELKNIRASRLPNLAAFGTAGYSRQSPDLGHLFNNKWYSYSLVGLNLTLPILSLQSQYQAKQARLKIQKNENDLSNFRSVIDFQAKQAEINLKNNLQSIEAQRKNMELAQDVARVTKIKYKEGVGSNLEVTTAEADLRAAQINYFNALYDAIAAKIDYQKALGTLVNE